MKQSQLKMSTGKNIDKTNWQQVKTLTEKKNIRKSKNENTAILREQNHKNDKTNYLT